MDDLRFGWRPPAEAVSLFDESFEPASVSAIRQAVLRMAAMQGLTDFTLTKFVTAVYEVTVNAVIHGGGCGRVQIWRTPGDLWCRITDRGPGIAAQYRTCDDRSASSSLGWGTGLWLTTQLCAEVHVGDNDDGGAFVVLRFPFCPTGTGGGGRA